MRAVTAHAHISRTPSARPSPDFSTCCGAHPTYERLVCDWKLDDDDAIGAVQWLITKCGRRRLNEITA